MFGAFKKSAVLAAVDTLRISEIHLSSTLDVDLSARDRFSALQTFPPHDMYLKCNRETAHFRALARPIARLGAYRPYMYVGLNTVTLRPFGEREWVV